MKWYPGIVSRSTSGYPLDGAGMIGSLLRKQRDFGERMLSILSFRQMILFFSVVILLTKSDAFSEFANSRRQIARVLAMHPMKSVSHEHVLEDDGFAFTSVSASSGPLKASLSRRKFVDKLLCTLTIPAAMAIVPPSDASAATSAAASATSGTLLDSVPFTKPANPFVQLETVGMVPKDYFEENRSIYAFTERILDGDTIRVRHVPGYSFTNQIPEPLQKRGIADDTLVIRLYGIDCPEIAKKKDQVSQPFAVEAKGFTSDLIYRRMVKVTFIRKDRYGRAIAMVETMPKAGFLLSGIPGLGPQDLTIELARAGLAELYTGGGSEYYTKKSEILDAIDEARRARRGIWSLGDSRVSAAEQKRMLRSEGQDPAAVVVGAY